MAWRSVHASTAAATSGWIPSTSNRPLREADQLDLVDGDAEVLPGIRLRPAPGHTPGHCVVTIACDREETTFLADAVLDDLNFEHPDWVSSVDHDPAETERTRTRLLTEAAGDGTRVLAYHMTGIGHVERRRSAFGFVRESSSTSTTTS